MNRSELERPSSGEAYTRSVNVIPVSDAYRDNFDRVFSGRPETAVERVRYIYGDEFGRIGVA